MGKAPGVAVGGAVEAMGLVQAVESAPNEARPKAWRKDRREKVGDMAGLSSGYLGAG